MGLGEGLSGQRGHLRAQLVPLEDCRTGVRHVFAGFATQHDEHLHDRLLPEGQIRLTLLDDLPPRLKAILLLHGLHDGAGIPDRVVLDGTPKLRGGSLVHQDGTERRVRAPGISVEGVQPVLGDALEDALQARALSIHKIEEVILPPPELPDFSVKLVRPAFLFWDQSSILCEYLCSGSCSR